MSALRVARIPYLNSAPFYQRLAGAGFELVGESDALERSSDDLQKGVFDESVRGNTSRFMLKFRKV